MPFSLSRRRWLVAPVLALGAALASGCFEDPGTITGEVSGKNQFRYVCDDTAAVGSCSGTASTFPSAVARGGLFRLAIDAASAREVDELEPISDEVVGTDASGAWVSNTEGLAGFVAFDRSGNVIDYVHVRIETPIRLAVESYGRSNGSATNRTGGSPISTLRIARGEEHVVAVKLFGKTATALAGSIPYGWLPATDGVVRVRPLGTADAPSAFAIVEGVAAGTTRIRVEGAALSSEVEVTVQ